MDQRGGETGGEMEAFDRVPGRWKGVSIELSLVFLNVSVLYFHYYKRLYLNLGFSVFLGF